MYKLARLLHVLAPDKKSGKARPVLAQLPEGLDAWYGHKKITWRVTCVMGSPLPL